MNKMCILFLSIFSLPAFSSGIGANSASAPCTNNTLETYSGNTNLQADWAPNTIDLRWYNGNTQIVPTNSTANTCTYDGSLTIPSTQPTRTGYTFAGWQVRPEMDFSTLNISESGIERWAVGVSGNSSNVCWHIVGFSGAVSVPCDSDDNFNELQQYEWKAKFSYGIVYGMSGCSTDGGVYAQSGNPTIGDGYHCWCKVTGYKPNNSNILYSPNVSTSWVLREGSYDVTSVCKRNCAGGCSYVVLTDSNFRKAVYGAN